MPRKSPPISIFAPFLGCVGALILAALCHYRVLPFLKEDTILSAGRQVPTKDFAESISRIFYRTIAVLLLAPKDIEK